MDTSRPRPDAPRRPWLHGLLVVGLLAALAVAGWALFACARGGSPASGPPSAGAASTHTPFLMGHGDVAGGVVPLYPLQPNRVVAVKVKEYEHVKKDEPLLLLDDRAAQAQLAKAEAALKAAEAQHELAGDLPKQHAEQVKAQQAVVEAREADVKAAEALKKRGEEHVKSGTMTKDEFVALERQLESAQAAVRGEQARLAALKLLRPELQAARAEGEVEAARAEVRRARQGVEECRLVAPCAGTVVRVLTTEGETLGPNPHQPALLLVPDDKALIVRAEVEQEFADDVQPGMAVEIFDDTRAARPRWTGKVSTVSNWYTHRRSILQEPLQMNDVRTLECIITDVAPIKEAGDKPPRIGQRVRVKPRP
jgi:multidrug resistance efflux pump